MRALVVFGVICAICLACSRQTAGAQPTPPSPSSIPASQPRTTPTPTNTSSGGSSTAWWPPDLSQLIAGLVTTFVGAFAALWTAFWLDRRSRRRTRAGEQAARADRLRETFDLIERELAWNTDEVAAIVADLELRLRTERAPMTDAWDAVGPEAMKAGGAAAASLSQAYALLRRCGRLLDQYANDSAQGGSGLRTAREDTLPRLRELIDETQAALEVARRRLREVRPANP